VTFYETFGDAVRAHKAFDKIARDLSHDRQVQATSWSFDVLGRPELNATILRDSARADVIVVATDGRSTLPERIGKWVEVCMNRNSDAKPVVVALHDDGLETEDAVAPLCSSLRKIAARGEAAFMCNADLASSANHEVPAEVPLGRREGANGDLEPALYPSTENLRWWGMND
jgi:hypothetical protein